MLTSFPFGKKLHLIHSNFTRLSHIRFIFCLYWWPPETEMCLAMQRRHWRSNLSVGSFLKQSPDKRLHGKGVSALQFTESRISDKHTETPEVKDNQCKTTREEIIKSIYLKKRDKKSLVVQLVTVFSHWCFYTYHKPLRWLAMKGILRHGAENSLHQWHQFKKPQIQKTFSSQLQFIPYKDSITEYLKKKLYSSIFSLVVVCMVSSTTSQQSVLSAGVN